MVCICFLLTKTGQLARPHRNIRASASQKVLHTMYVWQAVTFINYTRLSGSCMPAKLVVSCEKYTHTHTLHMASYFALNVRVMTGLWHLGKSLNHRPCVNWYDLHKVPIYTFRLMACRLKCKHIWSCCIKKKAYWPKARPWVDLGLQLKQKRVFTCVPVLQCLQ